MLAQVEHFSLVLLLCFLNLGLSFIDMWSVLTKHLRARCCRNTHFTAVYVGCPDERVNMASPKGRMLVTQSASGTTWLYCTRCTPLATLFSPSCSSTGVLLLKRMVLARRGWQFGRSRGGVEPAVKAPIWGCWLVMRPALKKNEFDTDEVGATGVVFSSGRASGQYLGNVECCQLCTSTSGSQLELVFENTTGLENEITIGFVPLLVRASKVTSCTGSQGQTANDRTPAKPKHPPFLLRLGGTDMNGFGAASRTPATDATTRLAPLTRVEGACVRDTGYFGGFTAMTRATERRPRRPIWLAAHTGRDFLQRSS